ncbi:MAG: hypothetical protein ABT20_03085 [Rubrivivax sp. SCN 70-15]|nr:MAG: hypothetical protein ABT20_03085 [Rubrivivax sp. SCN 70-15]
MPWPGVDPVSGEPLHIDTALPWFHRGKVYFFASESTRDCFAAMTGSSTHEVKRAPPVGPAAPDVRTIRSPSIQRRP